MAKLKHMFKKTAVLFRDREDRNQEKKEPSAPEGLWLKCPKCGEVVYRDDVKAHGYVCPKCEGYFRIGTRTRIRMVADTGTFQEWFTDLETENPLEYPGYEEKIANLHEKTKLHEAVTVGKCMVNGLETVLGVCDARFLMGSMGYVVGEKITRAFERATEEKLPVVLFTSSGGARMQEGIVSLMQMAKTSAAIRKHSEAGLFYLPVLTDPTTGGVTASFAMLGDVILAEPGALIGFAGPRVIAQTIGQKLPEGFQRAEFLVEKGIIDGVVERQELKETVWKLLKIHQDSMQYIHYGKTQNVENFPEIRSSRGKAGTDGKSELTAWERVEISRSKERPTTLSYVQQIFDEFLELHGDRAFRDDGAVIGGIAMFSGQPVTVIGQQKGKNVKENIYRNFGMASPEGYRKALRLMKQAEKFGRPVVTFVDTPGAACGIEAEERGQGEAIARNLLEMSGIRTPMVSILIGEGGSGGALGLAVTDEVWMMENATYSILSPEGFASILWKDGKRAKEASEVMRITAKDLKNLRIIERVIREPEPANEENLPEIAEEIREDLDGFLRKSSQKTREEIVEERYERFRRM
ncbi:acetyl-CoA carboxylase carboxyltransferase subunit beta [Blautia sp. AM16-16B]|uniref:acetyl-CoA carboxylase carboxyltransferase subunit alpha n=1 Tax=Blautia faecicola TaxID=2509240 RepID=UPI000E3F9CC0|nr:acetyl-CoA carboxylase carboxyltransferase subunit beta [Blautia sp. AM16-16B]RHS50552.1 acetyl-CoA carboxylase carboxyltransferase subunit beta [Blautia sp. AM46-5]